MTRLLGLLLTVLPLCLARPCGQKELKERHIGGCTSFEHIKLVGKGGAIWLGDALHNHTDLELLDLHHAKIGDDDAEALAEGLKNNDNLRRLAMHNNHIYDRGAIALAEALKTNKALTFLSLSSNGIGDEGAKALGEMLKVNKVLRRLDLYFNLVGEEGGVALAEGLMVNTALRTLHIDSNKMGDEAAIAISKAIKENHALVELTFMYNKIRNTGALAVMEAVKDSTSMHTLQMGHNHHVVGEAVEAFKSLKADHLVPRKEMMRWLADEGLTDDEGGKYHDPAHPETAKEKFDHHGPALHSPYAAAVKELQPHTPEGLQKLKAMLDEDEKALHSHDATAHLTDEQRHTFSELVHRKVKELSFSHDEL